MDGASSAVTLPGNTTLFSFFSNTGHPEWLQVRRKSIPIILSALDPVRKKSEEGFQSLKQQV